MSREIKFRIWDISGQTFMQETYKQVSSEETDEPYLTKYYQSKYRAVDLDFALSNTQDYAVQQDTGLRDKNGKEIYEGDILEVIDPTGEKKANVQYFQGEYWMGDGSDPFIETKRHSKVYWNDTNACFEDEYLDWFLTNSGDRNGQPVTGFISTRMSKVIGNIYENPELLKQNR